MRPAPLRLRRALALGSMLALLGAPALHAACCYFSAKEKDINQPGQKAFITWHPEEDIESFTVQPRFEGNAVDFGMVIPTPSQPKLDEMPRDFFTDLALYTILMPLAQPIWAELIPVPMAAVEDSGGAGPDLQRLEQKEQGVTVLEAGVVGSLDYKIILAEQASGLFDWLKDNGYSYSGDESTLDFYIQKKWFFTVMRIDPKQMKKNPDGSYLGEVTPTRFTFETTECLYPLKITQISVKDHTEALFYVQAPQQMDLTGDWSWRHSFRVMWLTYMLGCSANEAQQRELAERSAWVQNKMSKDPGYDTTKLEWARKLGPSDMAVLDFPLKNYSQMGGGDLPAGARLIPLQTFLDEIWADYKKSDYQGADDYAKQRLEELRQQFPAERGQIVKIANPGGMYTASQYMWYPNREAPEAEVKGISRLKGHLQSPMWITKFRKTFRKAEMSQDLDLVPVAETDQQEYIRILPTSPP